MGYLKDFYQNNLTIRKRYWLREIMRFRNWRNVFVWRHQRAERGWSDQDTWGGGEHIVEVCMGILRYLEREQNPVDWDEYFKQNYEDNYGYKNLTEVADDLQLYIDWEYIQYDEPLHSELTIDDRMAIDLQVYEQAKNAMHFVAANIGGLWW